MRAMFVYMSCMSYGWEFLFEVTLVVLTFLKTNIK